MAVTNGASHLHCDTVAYGVAKAICLMSGGMDSTVAAAWAARRYEILCLHIAYGQRAEEREREAAQAIATSLAVREFRTTRVPFLQELGHSALTDLRIDIPRGQISAGGEIPITQVPFRNGIFLSLATAWAEAVSAGAVVIGAVEEDSSGYPDCRENFMIAFERAVEQGIKPDRDIKIVAPLVHKRKREIVQLGIELSAPFHLNWSCYGPGPRPCGECESCLLRARGFAEAGILDPAL
jgi:7-cyano-7-deazaguanine synthase